MNPLFQQIFLVPFGDRIPGNPPDHGLPGNAPKPVFRLLLTGSAGGTARRRLLLWLVGCPGRCEFNIDGQSSLLDAIPILDYNLHVTFKYELMEVST